MEYQSPAAAFTNSIEDFMMKQQAAKLAAAREARAAQEARDLHEERVAALEEKRQENREKIREKDAEAVRKRVLALEPGDVYDAELIQDARKYHIDLPAQKPAYEQSPIQPEAPAGIAALPESGAGGIRLQPPTQLPAAPVPAQPLPMVARGTRAQRDQQEIDQLAQQIQTMEPGSPEFRRAATRYEMLKSGQIPAELLKGPKSDETEDLYIFDPIKGKYTSAKTGQEVSSIPKGAKVERKAEPREAPTVVIHTIDAQGNPVERIVPKQAGTEFEGRLPQQQQSRMYSARGVVSHLNEVASEIEDADNRGLLGPLQGRGAEFLAGRIGSTGDPDNDRMLNKLRTDLLLLRSGTTMVHFGARGGQQYIQKMNDILDSGKMSKDELLGAIDSFSGWLSTYAKDPRTARDASNPQKDVSQADAPKPRRKQYDPATGTVK